MSDLVELASPGVVSVIQEQVRFDLSGDPESVPAGSGAGIFIGDGRILTNAHVIRDAASVFVVAADGRQRPASVEAASPNRDLALLIIEDTEGLQALELRDSGVESGMPAVAIGNALGLDAAQPTVSAGIVSAVGRTLRTETAVLENLIQTDAAINPGNSGGPLLDREGRVIGVNTAIAGGQAQNVGFAIPASLAIDFIDRVDRGVGEPYLGVSVVDNSAPLAQRLGLDVAEGAVVIDVDPSSPAADVGLEQGHVIIGFDGTEIADAADLPNAVLGSSPGDVVNIEVVTPEGSGTIEVVIGERMFGG